MASVETLLQHERDVRQDLSTLGVYLDEPFSDSADQALLWWEIRHHMVSSRHASSPDELDSEPLRTEFGASLLPPLMDSEHGMLETDNDEVSQLNTCIGAEPLFYQCVYDHDSVSAEHAFYTPSPNILLEHQNAIVGLLKPYGEATVLGLSRAPGIYPGIISGFTGSIYVVDTVASAARELYRELPPAAILPLETVIDITGPPVPVRSTTFALDESIRQDFSSPGQPIVGVADMARSAEAFIDYVRLEARARAIGRYATERMLFMNAIA